MTAAMLATYPEVFAGGAVIAGLPYGAAGSVQEAMGAMGQVRRRTPREWGDLVRRASPHRGPWPTVQIWHGDADHTVNVGNADALAAQWADVLGLPPAPATQDDVDGARHSTWLAPGGAPALQRWIIPGLGHGTPVGTAGTDADQRVGVPGPHMLASVISSTWHLARSWGLLTQPARTLSQPPPKPAATGPAGIIEKALKSAGLLR